MDAKKIAIGVLALAIIAAAVWQFGSSDQASSENNSTIQSTQTEVMESSITTTEETSYVDGTYVAIGNYTSPAQEEEIEITITLEDDVITQAVFEGKGTHETTKKMQGKFSEGFEEEVVGMPIDEIALTTVNGSSLTPKGFMDALEKVKQQAAQS